MKLLFTGTRSDSTGDTAKPSILPTARVSASALLRMTALERRRRNRLGSSRRQYYTLPRIMVALECVSITLRLSQSYRRAMRAFHTTGIKIVVSMNIRAPPRSHSSPHDQSYDDFAGAVCSASIAPFGQHFSAFLHLYFRPLCSCWWLVSHCGVSLLHGSAFLLSLSMICFFSFFFCFLYNS